MPTNLGKKFEYSFKEDIVKHNYFIYRLPDQMTGMKSTSANPCDFFVYCKPYLRLIECKSVHGNTFPLKNFTQYDRMKSYVKDSDAIGALIVWFVDHDVIIYANIETVTEMLKEGKKSINIKNLDGLKVVQTKKKRLFLTGDYSFFKEAE